MAMSKSFTACKRAAPDQLLQASSINFSLASQRLWINLSVFKIPKMNTTTFCYGTALRINARARCTPQTSRLQSCSVPYAICSCALSAGKSGTTALAAMLPSLQDLGPKAIWLAFHSAQCANLKSRKMKGATTWHARSASMNGAGSVVETIFCRIAVDKVQAGSNVHRQTCLAFSKYTAQSTSHWLPLRSPYSLLVCRCYSCLEQSFSSLEYFFLEQLKITKTHMRIRSMSSFCLPWFTWFWLGVWLLCLTLTWLSWLS